MRKQRAISILLSAGCAVYSFFPVLFPAGAQTKREIAQIEEKIVLMENRTRDEYERVAIVETRLDGIDKKLDLLLQSKETVTNSLLLSCFALVGGSGLTLGVMAKRKKAA